MILIGLKLLSNEVSRFVEADEVSIEETQVRTKTKNSTDYWLKFSNNRQRREEKISNLKATKYQIEINEALDNFALCVINK